MIPLDSAEWANLQTAYGPATGTPNLLRQLRAEPRGEHAERTWNTMFSSLLHQGTVWQAAMAAVPHLVAISRTLSPAERTTFVEFCGATATELNPDPSDPLWQECFSAFTAMDAQLDEMFAAPNDEMKYLQFAGARCAFRGCVRTARLIEDRADGMTFEPTCLACGESISIDFVPGAALDRAFTADVFTFDDDHESRVPTTLTGLPLTTFDSQALWTENDAVARSVAELNSWRHFGAGALAASLHCEVACPKCSETFELRLGLEANEVCRHAL